MTDRAGDKPKNPFEHPIPVDVAIARFRALKDVGGNHGFPVMHDALGLPFEVGDEVIWAGRKQSDASIVLWRGQVMDRGTEQCQVFNWHTERKLWMLCERVVCVTRLLKGGER